MEFVSRGNNVHTNTIEGNWSGMNRNIPLRRRTFSFIKIYLLRFMLPRNNSASSFVVNKILNAKKLIL